MTRIDTPKSEIRRELEPSSSVCLRLVQLRFACGQLLFLSKGSTICRNGFQSPSGFLILEYLS